MASGVVAAGAGMGGLVWVTVAAEGKEGSVLAAETAGALAGLVSKKGSAAAAAVAAVCLSSVPMMQ